MSKYNDTKTRIVAINELKMYKFAELPVLFIGGSLTPAFLHSHTHNPLCVRVPPIHVERALIGWASQFHKNGFRWLVFEMSFKCVRKTSSAWRSRYDVS